MQIKTGAKKPHIHLPEAGVPLCLSHLLSGEHSLGPPQDGVLVGVVGVVLGGDLQDGRDGRGVRVNRRADHLSDLEKVMRRMI